MGRTRKPRKAYRPSAVDALAHDTAMARASLLRPEQRLELLAPVRRALANMRMGIDPDAAWCGLADAMNVAEQLASIGIASDRVPEFMAAQAALQAVHTRRATLGRLVCTGTELKALDEAVMLHGVQLQVASQGEVAAAIQAVKNRVSQALAGNAPRDALVCVGELGNARLSG
jgi:hypothetical protein